MTDQTKEILAGMLLTSTGASALDSGGYYGRGWQRAQAAIQAATGKELQDIKVDEKTAYFDSLLPSIVEFSTYKNQSIEINQSHHIFHWLSEKLEYCPEMDGMFNAYLETQKDSQSYLADIETFLTYFENAGGIYGDGDPVSFNSYNEDNLLSDVIQGTYFCIENGEYVLLQIHRGCDVRGGYTRPTAFKCTEEVGIFDWGRGTLYAQDLSLNYSENWYTDDGYHYYFDGGGSQLNDYKLVDSRDKTAEDSCTVYVDEETNEAFVDGYKLNAGF